MSILSKLSSKNVSLLLIFDLVTGIKGSVKYKFSLGIRLYRSKEFHVYV